MCGPLAIFFSQASEEAGLSCYYNYYYYYYYYYYPFRETH